MLDVGWSCPRCRLVLAPSVAEHRCAPPAAGVPAPYPLQIPPRPNPVGISAPNVWSGTVAYPETWTVTTTNAAYLAAVPDTDGMPPRREITETAA